jgi:hypothetical protein
MIKLLELLGGPGRFILGLGPPPGSDGSAGSDGVSSASGGSRHHDGGSNDGSGSSPRRSGPH